MSLGKRVVSVFVILAMLVSVFYTARVVKEQEKQEIFDYTRTLHLWYADESLTDYLSSVAVKYNEEHGVRVIPVLQTGLEFFEQINEASLREEATPDLFIAGNDSMEKAWLAGLTAEISNPGNVVSTDYFPQSAIDAVTYQEKLLGYPFYYETSALLYNRTYFEELAKEEIVKELEEEAKKLVAEQALTAEMAVPQTEEMQETEAVETGEEGQTPEGTGEAAEAAETSTEGKEAFAAEELISEEELAIRARERAASMVPDTFDELLAFADSYEAPAHVEAVFRWDVSDIFFNYFFVGNYIDIGGPCGDDVNLIDLYNLDAILSLKAYQDLGQYFAIEADEVNYQTVISDFIQGKIVMTTATTDIVSILAEAKESGEFVYDYGIARIPDLSEERKTKNISTTSTVYVNSYSPLKEEANHFAAYLINDRAADLYALTGKVTANQQIQQENEHVAAFMQEYVDSVSLPKMVTTSNLWVDMEIVFSKIWKGAEVSTELMLMSERLMSKVTGESYTETYIEMPEESEEYYEFVDE